MRRPLPGSEPDEALWAATAPPAPPAPPLVAERHADVVVVGGGYTGLSAALHLAESGADTVLLEAHAPGHGASGRNTGEVVPGWSKHGPDEVVARFGHERGEAMNAWVQASAALVFERIARHAIDCQAVRHGWLMPASNARRLAVVRSKHDQWAARGAPVEMLDAARTAELTGSDHYVGAWLHREGGTIQPLAYARGLAAAAQAAGAALHGDSQAQAIVRQGSGWKVRTARGAVTADAVVLATNAYSGRLWPDLARSIIPLRLFQTATAPLGDNLAGTVLPQGHGISDSRRVLWAFRKDAHGRLVTGVTPLATRVSRGAMERMANHQLATVYPHLGRLPIEYFWNGLIAVTLDRLPRLHDVAEGVHAGLGYSGRGIAMATGMGKLLAERATGTAPAALAMPVSALRPLPMQRLLVPLARARAWWWRMADLREDRATAKGSRAAAGPAPVHTEERGAR